MHSMHTRGPLVEVLFLSDRTTRQNPGVGQIHTVSSTVNHCNTQTVNTQVQASSMMEIDSEYNAAAVLLARRMMRMREHTARCYVNGAPEHLF